MGDSYRQNLEDKRAELDKLQTEIKELEEEIEQIKERKETEENEAVEETLKEDQRQKEMELGEKKEELEELRNEYLHATDIEKKIATERGKIEKIIEEGQTQISKIEEQQNQLNQELQEIREKRQEINELVSRIEELEETAEGLLERTTSGALGEQFEDRQKELQKDLRFWLRASFASIAVLIISSLIIYADIALSPESAVISISKLALLLPISVIVWFSVSNYSRTRKLMEEYEFKARIGLSLNGFREVLHAEISDEQSDEVAQFVMETMDKIYSNPQQIVVEGQPQEEQVPLPTGQKPLVEFVRRLGNK